MTGYQLRAFVAWARRGVVIQGGRLIEHLHFDGPAQADQILAEAAELGWIQRRNYEPTAELRFFGVGGKRGGERYGEEHDCPCEFAWEVMLSAPVWNEEAERALEDRASSLASAQLRGHRRARRRRTAP